MARHHPDLDSASDWLNQISHAARPIRSTTQIWVVTRHQYGISALVPQTSFGGKTNGGVAKCRLFSQAKVHHTFATQLRREISYFRIRFKKEKTIFSFSFWTLAACNVRIPLQKNFAHI